MTAQTLLDDLIARGITLTPSDDGEWLDVDGPADVLTDELMAALRDHKAELLAALRTRPADRPRLGSFARPMAVRGREMPTTDCLWATCGGSMTAHGRTRYLCASCGTWFELLPPEDLGVYVGDLADEYAGAKTEWIM